MKKFIDFCILYALFIYTNYIYEDWSIYNKIGKIYYYPFWFIRSCLIWLFCPIFLPEYWFKQTDIYKHIKKLNEDPKYQEQISKTIKNFNF